LLYLFLAFYDDTVSVCCVHVFVVRWVLFLSPALCIKPAGLAQRQYLTEA
jgi:hypothetical protein